MHSSEYVQMEVFCRMCVFVHWICTWNHHVVPVVHVPSFWLQVNVVGWCLFCGQFFFLLSPCDVLTLVFPYCPFLSASMATAKDFPGTTTGKYFCWSADIIIARQGAVMWLVEWWDGLRQLTSSIAWAGSHCLAWEHCWSLWNVMVLHGAVIHTRDA